ncbi:galactose mutarotase-like [Tigriopus californicus]|uniref:galactose mutarotase-like n=1 Tax=Tigriopus californicus TaxID=6832 RepID=UPI0027DA708A|nr:galactose mutarotase-like [Tigriopus californicus]
MVVQTGYFGTAEGKSVTKFTLDNGTIKITLISYGAAVQSLFVPDRKGQLEDIVLGFDDIQGYLGKNPYFGCIVGRVANRIADARFTLNGQSYQLDKNNGPNALHGGLKGLDKVVWNGEINPNTENSVTFSYLSPDGENQYPGNLMINVTYTLTSSNELQIRYLALGDQSTPVNLASHTYYNLGGHASGSESLSSHEVRFNADHMTPVSDKLIPTGEIKPVDGTDFDLRQKQVLGPLIEKTGGYDHNLCLKDYTDIKEEDIKFCGRMEHPLTGRALEVWSNQPGIQFYTGNFLPVDNSIKGKNGVFYQKHGGICLETQSFPDAVNQENFPNVILNLGRVYKHHTDIKFLTF